MQLFEHHSLKSLNSFAVDASASRLVIVEQMSDLDDLPSVLRSPVYLLGEGSNTLFLEDFDGTVVVPKLRGIRIESREQDTYVEVAAGENWHQLVLHLLERGIYGLENLALIPGSVGAAPIQNVGAYGVEFSDFCHSVLWFELATGELKELSAQDCGFGYRDSIFKGALAGQGVILQVNLTLPINWQPVLSYGPLQYLAAQKNISASVLFEKVVAIRQSKLPDPAVLPNAGSFFKNPVVSADEFSLLQAAYPAMPAYPQPSGEVKLAAGWLIEQAGLKGYQGTRCAVHDKQALVLVNQGGSGQDILQLARLIQEKVAEKFSVALTPEVRLVARHGLVK